MSATHERFLLRTMGGPLDQETRIANTEADPVKWTWPLPGILKYDATGYYEKISESQLPPQERDDSRILRGALYEWRSSGQG